MSISEVPTWAWVLFVFQFGIGVSLYRIEKAVDGLHEKIYRMKYGDEP